MKIVETHKKYLDDCGEGVYVPTTVSVVEKGRVFDLKFDDGMTDADRARGWRGVDMTTKLSLPEALGLFKEINNVTYEAFELHLATHNAYGGALMRMGAKEIGTARGIGDRLYKINRDIIDQIVAADLYLEAIGSSNKFSPEFVSIPGFKEVNLEIQRMWGKDPTAESQFNETVEAYFLTSTITADPGVVEEHMHKLEEAVKKWNVEGNNPVGKGIDFHRR